MLGVPCQKKGNGTNLWTPAVLALRDCCRKKSSPSCRSSFLPWLCQERQWHPTVDLLRNVNPAHHRPLDSKVVLISSTHFGPLASQCRPWRQGTLRLSGNPVNSLGMLWLAKAFPVFEAPLQQDKIELMRLQRQRPDFASAVQSRCFRASEPFNVSGRLQEGKVVKCICQEGRTFATANCKTSEAIISLLILRCQAALGLLDASSPPGSLHRRSSSQLLQCSI